MKNISLTVVFSAFLILFSQTFFAQTKIAESAGGDCEAGGNELNKLIEHLKQNPEASGFIIVHSGKTRERLGNILAFIERVEYETNFRLGDKGKISVAVIEGKKTLYMEFWSIPKGKNKPEAREIKIELNNLKEKYFYADMCIDCCSFSPSIYRENFKPYIEALKKNPTYRALIVVHTESIHWGERMKEDLVEKYKLNSDQIIVELGENYELFHPVYDFYIIPQKKD